MPTVSSAGGNLTEALLICELPGKMRLDTPWPSRRLRLDSTPDRIAFDAVNNIYAILSTKEVSGSALQGTGLLSGLEFLDDP